MNSNGTTLFLLLNRFINDISISSQLQNRRKKPYPFDYQHNHRSRNRVIYDWQ